MVSGNFTRVTRNCGSLFRFLSCSWAKQLAASIGGQKGKGTSTRVEPKYGEADFWLKWQLAFFDGIQDL